MKTQQRNIEQEIRKASLRNNRSGMALPREFGIARCRVALLVLIAALLALTPVRGWADPDPPPIDAHLPDPGSLGNLAQCAHSQDCGPTSVANALYYLNNEYPSVYHDNIFLHDLSGMEAALALWMGTDHVHGTFWQNLLLGEINYMNQPNIAPGSSVFVGQSQYQWNPQQSNGSAKPAGMSDGTNPTVQFIAFELNLGRPVEVLFENDNRPGGHWVMVTDIVNFQIHIDDNGQETGQGVFIWVDPLTGQKDTQTVTLGNGKLGFTDLISLNSYTITVDVAQGPTPEPSSLLLLGSGFICGAGFLRRRLRAQHH